jgi:endonuclease/exonuclease/phosphatase family metal-dependent hydrolase
MERFWKAIRRLMFSFNVLASLASLLVFAAGYLSPANYWPLVFMPYFSLPLLIIHLLFIGWWTLGRRWQVLLSVSTLLLGWSINQAAFQWTFREKETVDDIRILSYNVGNFRENGTEKIALENTQQSILNLINEKQPDVLCLQEYFSKRRGQGGFTDLLFDKMSFEQGYFEKIVGADGYGFSGIAIFSKYPIINRQYIPFQVKNTVNACIYADILVGNKIIRVINLHLQTNRLQGEELEYVRELRERPDVASGKGLLKIMDKIRFAARERAMQAEMVRSLIDTTPHPIVLCGDFNDLPASYAYRTIRGPLIDTFVKKGNGFGNTYAGFFPSFRIDQIFVSRHFHVSSQQIIRQRYSDHYPVFASVRLQQP